MHLIQNNSKKSTSDEKSKWILIAVILVAVIATGCVEEKNKTIATPNPQKTPEAAIFPVEKSVKEAPKTPITISMSIPPTLSLNKVSDINITTSSVRDAPNTKIELILPEGVSLVSDTSTWEVDLTANKPVTFSAKIMLIKTGSWDIKVIAKRVLDQENIWGDMDIAYIGYPPSINITPARAVQKNRS